MKKIWMMSILAAILAAFTLPVSAQCVLETRHGGNHPTGPIVRPPYITSVTALGPTAPTDGTESVVGNHGVIRIRGAYLAANSGIQYQVTTPEWRTNLGGNQVLVNGNPVPVQVVSDNEIIAQIPGGTLTGASLAVKTANGCESSAVSLKVYPAAPSFVTNPDGTVAATKNVDGSYSVMAYGLGDAINDGLVDGKPAPAALATLYPVSVTIAGRPASVTFAGTTTQGVGMYRIDFQGYANFRGGPPIVRVTQLGVSSTFTLPQ